MFNNLRGCITLVIFHEALPMEEDIVDNQYQYGLIPFGKPQQAKNKEMVTKIEEQSGKTISHVRHFLNLKPYEA